MTEPLKILHIAPWAGAPYSGLNTNIFNFLQRLTPQHDARFIIVGPASRRGEITGESLAEMGIPNSGLTFIPHGPVNRFSALRGLLGREHPFALSWRREIGEELTLASETIVRTFQPDLLIVWWWAFGGVLAELPQLHKLLYMGDSLTLGVQVAVKGASGAARRLYSRLILGRSKVTEEYLGSRYDRVIFITQRDADHARLSAAVSIIGNGVDAATERYKREYSQSPRIITFHGDFGFPPNLKAFYFLLGHIGPLFQREFGLRGFEIHFVGDGLNPALLPACCKPDWVRVFGYVEDLNSRLCEADLYVAPILYGSGMKNKTLDAMLCGLPVVGTAEAFSGLDVRNGEHCVVAAMETIAAEAAALFKNPNLCERIGRAGRQWVIENMSWDIQAAKFQAAIDEM